jgi:hypothetical protein
VCDRYRVVHSVGGGLDSIGASGLFGSSKENHDGDCLRVAADRSRFGEANLDAVTADPGVAWAEPVTGPYDVIAAVQDDPPEVLKRLELPGVTRTITCPAAGS